MNLYILIYVKKSKTPGDSKKSLEEISKGTWDRKSKFPSCLSTTEQHKESSVEITGSMCVEQLLCAKDSASGIFVLWFINDLVFTFPQPCISDLCLHINLQD